MTFDNNTIRSRFRVYKFEHKLSLDVIAKKSGVSKSTLSRFHCGKVNPEAETLLKIAMFIGIRNMAGGVECDGDTLKNVREAIHADAHLSAEDKDRLWHLFEAMYGSLRD